MKIWMLIIAGVFISTTVKAEDSGSSFVLIDNDGVVHGPIDGPTERQMAEKRKQKRIQYQSDLDMQRKMIEQRTVRYYQQRANKVERVEAPFKYKKVLN